jgi:hypothetical protein
VVEVFAFVEPLFSKVMLSSPLKSLVNWSKVFQAALGRDKGVGRIICYVVLEHEAEWKPSLFNFWVRVCSCTKVFVNFLEDV